MKDSIFRVLARLRSSPSAVPEEPIRAEIFSADRLEQHAETLAAAQKVSVHPHAGRRMGRRLYDNAAVLVDAYRKMAEATRRESVMTPAAEWLLDNFHIVEEQIREIKDDLPPRYYRELPKISEGHLKGYPRVFGLAWAFIAHTDSRVDLPVLVRFVNAYQRVQPLTIGELWAIAITLRITLVENLRRLAELMVRNRDAKAEADAVADRLLGAGGRDPEPAESVLRAYDKKKLEPAFAAQLEHRLRDQDASLAPALRWLDEKLAAQSMTHDQIVQEELRLQGTLNVTVRNVITSMRQISMIDWADFFESVSLVDATLRADSEFGAMDFPTRNLYRRAIEELARGSNEDELKIAKSSVAAAKRAANRALGGKLSDRERDPGYYLIGRGRIQLERELAYRPSPSQWFGRLDSTTGSAIYLAFIALTTVAISALAVYGLLSVGVTDWRIFAFAFLAILPASDGAVALVNRVITNRLGPAILPGMALPEGVSSRLRTIVVMPVLLTGRAQVEQLIDRLEVHHLGSSDAELYYALLSDWTDSGEPTAPGDDELLEAATRGIAELNRRYGSAAAGDRFLLLHRRRVWNEGEGKWIGWERKRGKLHELNRLLRGFEDTTFLPINGRPPQVPPDVRYVITLDADTRLPRESTKRLVGKMAHPLNQPRLDAKMCGVVEGHAILQPRVTPSLPIGREGSLFQRVFSTARGLDAYVFAVSDVYQDLFQEGSYCGKGIYDVDAFEAALDGRIPESSVLSHDLLEGSIARAGLVSDIEVVEEFPSRYEVAAARQHRWARGDWQLLPWILGYGRDPYGRKRNVVNLIGRWKMLDNLRRSLSAPALLLALICGWMLPSAATLLWTGFLMAIITLPSLLPWFTGLLPRSAGISKRSHLRGVGRDLAVALIQIGFLITFLAHQAWLMLDAVIRTLFRLFLRRRRLLEWVTAAQVTQDTRRDWRGILGQTAASAGFSLVVLALVHLARSGTELLAALFLLLWTASPVIAWWASRSPPTLGHVPLSESDRQLLRLVSRRTWRFFETFICGEDHDLPPDNFQEDPVSVVAHRTSPTNIGLYLLSIIAAHDFGWIGEFEALERFERIFDTLNKLERFRGHFYNWYGTSDLRPLIPRYISTVDSGNLAGHLIVVAHACREIAELPKSPRERLNGVSDAIELASQSLKEFVADLAKPAARAKRLQDALDAMSLSVERKPDDWVDFDRQLAELATSAEALATTVRTFVQEVGTAGNDDLLFWFDAIGRTVRSHRRDLQTPANQAVRGRDGRWQEPVRVAAAGAHGSLAYARDELPDEGEETQTLVRLQTKRGAQARAAERPLSRPRPDPTLAPRLEAIAELADEMFAGTKFDFLYEPDRGLFAIGYRVEDAALDPNCYDLLASEARLASFIAIAKEEAPQKHWFKLGRTLTPVGHGAALISWSGSMFEYLMPSLVMRAPAGSILEQTNRLVVRRQIQYGRERHVPWGISESEFNARDLEATYQYSSFGVPDLGYKRGLGENIVIAPYATGLAAMIEPAEAAKNFRSIEKEGGRGAFGFYEALDYTPERVPEGAKVGIVRAYMAHHQAMTIVAIADVISTADMRERFHAEPTMQATELLLQERMPRDITVARPPAEKEQATAKLDNLAAEIQRRHKTPHSRIPLTHLISNGTYAVMLTGAGSGYSRWRNLDITRWQEDVTCDQWGSYIYLRDTRSGEVWSAGHQPTGVEADDYEVAFSEGRAEFTRHDGALKTTYEVAVSAEHDVEVRRLDITNLGSRAREIELTSYAELSLAPHGDDAAHPAFAKLFVQTEFVPGANTILATRRRKSSEDAEVWAAHTVSVEGEWDGSVQFETDRARFLGRGRRVREPSCLIEGWPLSNSHGSVLDPIFSLRCRVRIPKGATARISFWTAAATTREEALDLADRHRDASAFDRVITLAWTQAQGQFHHLGIRPEEANLYQRIANRILYSDQTLRASQETLKRGGRNISTLWPHGISGDLPIVLLRIDDAEQIHMVRQLLRAFEYWRLKRVSVDLVILNERASSYLQDLQATISGLVRPIQSRPKAGRDDVPGAVFVLRADLIPPEVRDLLQTVARVVLFSRRGPLSEQIKRIEEANQPVVFQPALVPSPVAPPRPAAARPALEFFNGLGGFDSDGKEYVTFLDGDAVTPAPWINVVCNPTFGFQVSTAGAGFTWATNSQQNRLTPWSNDAVSDPPGEAIFLRDEDSAELWCPTPSPIHDPNASYTVRHGRGYTRFEHDSRGLALELLQYVALDDPIKISRLKITNHSRRARNLSVTAYVEWVLGTTRERSAPYVVTEIDHETGAMFARNPLSNEFGTQVAFADLDGRQNSWTGDRTEFLGRNGTLSRPIALLRGTKFSNRTGAGYDPCCALQATLRLKSGESIELVVLLGQTASAARAQSLIAKYRTADLDQVFGAVTRFWDETLGKVQIRTPDRALDVLVNHWIPYQTIACRVWARSGFYQSSGAYGFRDQLQDSSSLCAIMPDIAREHILRAASRQFIEGDVQHWWLPETGRGVRTRISDDRIWLPYIVRHYVDITGDTGVLDEKVPFLEGPVLREGERDAFFQPPISEKKATLFEHCALALDTALELGQHGLPLMGTGDWNDGMNRVGEQGKGESVWLGWFLYATLLSFAPIAEGRGMTERAAKWRAHCAALKGTLDQAWDGDWYKRAYFDDGTPLGSVSNSECRIDSIAQSWSVISGAGERAKSVRAMAALEKYLVKRDEGLVLLFTPPFDKAMPDPGYIKGYPAGIRENGGQYTHAALWAALASAMTGDGDKAHEILSMINPINHAASNAAIHRYKVEPYVVAADVYSVAPHIGRGGWTWYTGSAGWMYRVALESVLGLRLQGDKFVVDPCIPRHWPGFELVLRFGDSTYLVNVENPNHLNRGVSKAELDDLILTSVPPQILLRDDRETHRLKIVLG